MRKAISFAWEALVSAYDVAWELMLANIFWVFLTIPVVTAPAALAGLFYNSQQLAEGESEGWKTFFIGMRKYLWAGYKWALVNLFVLASLYFYLWYFSGNDSLMGSLIRAFDLGVAFWWLIVQIFVFPFMLYQEKPGLLHAMRNSLVIYARYPGITLVVVLEIIILIAVSTWLRAPWIILTAGICSYLSTYAVKHVMEAEYDPQGEKENSSNESI